MIETSTHYIFQYSYISGDEKSLLINSRLVFDHKIWLTSKINKIIASTPEIPEEVLKRILEKANID